MPSKNQEKYLEKKKELKEKLTSLGIEKNKKKEEIRKALSYNTELKKNAPLSYTHRVVVEKEARQNMNEQFREENAELITAIKKLSEEQKAFIKEKINLYQVDEVIKLYKDLGLQEPGVFIIVAKAYKELWQHPTRKNKDNTRRTEKENKIEEQYKNEKAGIIAAELYERVGSKEVYDGHEKTEKAYEKAGNIYTALGMRIKAAESFEKAEKWEKAARAYSDAAFHLTKWYVYYEKSGEMYEKLDMLENAYDQYDSFNLAKPGERRIQKKLVELNEKIIKEYEDEWDIRWLARRYEVRGEKQLAAETYEKVEDWENAIRLYDELKQEEKAVKLFANYNDPENRAQEMGKRYKKLGKWGKSIEVYKKWNQPYEVLRLYLQNGKVEMANQFFYEYKGERRRETVKNIYERAGISTPSGLKRTMMDIRKNRASKLKNAEWLMSGYHHKEALEIYKRLEERKLAWVAASRLADYKTRSQSSKRESKEEIRSLRELAIEMFTKVEDFKSIAEVQEKIGNLIKDESWDERSKRKNHDIWDPTDEHIKAAALLDNEAKEWYRKACENYRKIGNWDKVEWMYHEIGERDKAYFTLLNHNIKGERRNIDKGRREDRGRNKYLETKKKLLDEKKVK